MFQKQIRKIPKSSRVQLGNLRGEHLLHEMRESEHRMSNAVHRPRHYRMSILGR